MKLAAEVLPSPRARRLDKLEALRGFAAVYVCLHHANPLAGTPFHWIFRFGQEAVMLFFLVSGFVIYYATFGGSRVPTFREYFVRRLRRIYPLFVVALAASFVVGRLRGVPFSGFGDLFGNLAMLQDLAGLRRGVWFATFMGNLPLWSLSYEWWFYMLFFPLAMKLRGQPGVARVLVFALSAVAALAYAVYPATPTLILAYFFIWWCGVELAREYINSHTLTVARQAPSVLFLSALAGLWLVQVLHAWRVGVPIGFATDPVLQFRHCLASLVMLVIGLAWFRVGLRGFDSVFGWLKVLAPFSYALYISHFIVLGALPANMSAPLRTAVFLPIAITVAYLLELRLQPVLLRAFTMARGAFVCSRAQ